MQKKKLIEVALPLEAINKASAREKSIRHGHPSTLHLWWARRPLAAARAVIFAQMVDDPSAYADTLRADPKLRRRAEGALKARMKLWDEARAVAKKAKGSGLPVPEPGPAPTLDDMLADQERQRLFRIIEDLVLWENTTNETVLQAARDEIWQSWRRACAENAGHPRAKELFDRKKLPVFHDPFAGGGALPLEAQRLALKSYASDLNPVAVLINKAMIEIPSMFAGKPPVNPEAHRDSQLIANQWRGAQGLADDVRYYGQWMHDEAAKRIGHFYPDVHITAAMAIERPDLTPHVGQRLTVIAWLWARTVKSPDPAFASVQVPLVTTFMLSTRKGREVYVEPIVEGATYRFAVRKGPPKDREAADGGTKLGRGANFRCLVSGSPVTGDYIKAEAQAGRMGARILAVVTETDHGRMFLEPQKDMESVALRAAPPWKPDVEFFQQALGFRVGNYGMTKWSDLFTNRQLLALTTFADLVKTAQTQVVTDATRAGLEDDGKKLEDGGRGITAYAQAVTVYLGLTSSKAARFTTTLSTWRPDETKLSRAFARNDLPMTWDFAETNPFSGTGGDLAGLAAGTASVLENLPATPPGVAETADASAPSRSAELHVVSTDPPYYDNVGYADLSDYFYVWLRHSLRTVLPNLFSTLASPKMEELVATPHRHGGTERAEAFFLNGMTNAIRRIVEEAHPAFPVTIYYAFKQAESNSDEGTGSTGWDTFLEAVIRAGFSVSGTWPVRTEGRTRMRSMGSNALASSIVLVCRPRTSDLPNATRREFINVLKGELPIALADLQRANIAPVDLAQAAIGPGMAVYTRYSRVLDAEGQPLRVRQALALINHTLDEALSEQEGDFDADSRWALTWFEQSGFDDGEYGVAETLATARNTSVSGLVEAGVVLSRRGKVRLLRPEELPANWDPTADTRMTAWEIVHHLIRGLDSGGEGAAAELVATLGAKAEVARELAYRLYTLCERKKRAAEALAYNGLVQSWPEIARLAREGAGPKTEQGGLFGGTEE